MITIGKHTVLPMVFSLLLRQEESLVDKEGNIVASRTTSKEHILVCMGYVTRTIPDVTVILN